MMLRSSATLDPEVVLNDLRLTADGKVKPILVWEKHPAVVVAAVLLLLILLLLLRRLLFPRRRTGSPGPAPTA